MEIVNTNLSNTEFVKSIYNIKKCEFVKKIIIVLKGGFIAQRDRFLSKNSF